MRRDENTGAPVDVDALLRFAAARIPERPAVPKEIFFVDKLPLTAVGKPMKHVLQADIARRVFGEALRAVPGRWDLDVVNTGGSGLKLVVRLDGASPDARARADAILSAYATPYVIVDAA